MAQGGVIVQSNSNNTVSVVSQESQVIVAELSRINESVQKHISTTEKQIEVILRKADTLHGVVSIKEYRAKEGEYERARKASSLNQ
jgi:hypothetical protein